MTKASETIRAASLVGGPTAIELIEDIVSKYPEDQCDSLLQEVKRAAQYFDTGDYEHRVVVPLETRISAARKISKPDRFFGTDYYERSVLGGRGDPIVVVRKLPENTSTLWPWLSSDGDTS